MSAAPDPIDALFRRVQKRMLAARIAWAVMRGTNTATLMVTMIVTMSAAASLAQPTGLPFHAFAMFAVFTFVTSTTRALFRSGPDAPAILAHIDRSLGLHELLASAYWTRGNNDAASRSLRSMAADVARQHRAEEVPVGAPTLRGALASALALTTMLTLAAILSDRGSRASSPKSDRATVESSPRDERSTAIAAVPHASGASAAPRQGDSISNDASNPASEEAIAASAASNERRGTTDDRGGVAGATEDRVAPTKLDFSKAARSPAESVADATAVVSGSTSDPETPTSDASVSATPTSNSLDRAPLRASSAEITSAARTVVTAALAEGRVPVHCRDIARAYFDVTDAAAASPTKESAGR